MKNCKIPELIKICILVYKNSICVVNWMKKYTTVIMAQYLGNIFELQLKKVPIKRPFTTI